MGPWGGFVTGIAENIEYVLTPAVIVFFIGTYAEAILGTPPMYQPFYWLAGYLIFLGLNLFGVELSFRVTVFVTLVALAVLMPIVASIGGNAGTQTLAVTVRALATNQLTQSNTMRSIWREIRVALLIGATIAVIAGLGAGLIFGNWLLAGVIAAAILCNISLAGLSGVAIPVLLDRLDQDPAVSSSIFVTMITDSMGFLIFLGLAVFSGLAG